MMEKTTERAHSIKVKQSKRRTYAFLRCIPRGIYTLTWSIPEKVHLANLKAGDHSEDGDFSVKFRSCYN